MQEQQPINYPISYQEYIELYKRRSNLRQKNLQQEARSSQFNSNQPKKNAQLKIIQKFISKLKIDNKNGQAILNQIDQLILLKHLDQVSAILASSVNEKDIELFTKIATKLNISYEDFPEIIIKDLNKNFVNAFESADDNKIKMKSLLLFMTELHTCGFSFSYKEIIDALKKIFQSGNKKKTIYTTEIERKLFAFYYSSQTFTSFLINYGQLFTVRTPKWIKKWTQQGKQILKLKDYIPSKVREQLTSFFTKYVSQCSMILQQSYQKIKQYYNILKESLKIQGEINKEVQRKYSDILQKFTATRNNLYIIADTLSFQGQIVKRQPIITVEQIIKQSNNHLQGVQIFQDQFQKQLYLDLPQFPLSQQKAAAQTQYKQFRQKLQSCKNMIQANQLLLQFSKINSRKTRKLLAKDTLQNRKEFNLIAPYLCRMIASINKTYKDIGQYVIDTLFQDYQKMKQAPSTSYSMNDKKTRNIKYICQFTKFNVIDPEKTISCIRYLVQDLKGHNIQLLITALQKVGRFLYLTPSTTSKFSVVLTLLDNVMKKSAFPLFISSQLMNSINLIKPHFEQIKNQQVKKTSIQQKVQGIFQKSIISDLDFIIKQILKVIKTKEGLLAVQKQIISKIQKYEFLGVYNYVYLIQQLQIEQLETYIIDEAALKLKESIQTGQNQKSLFWAKFYAQLYNYGLIKRSFLYQLIEQLLTKEDNQIATINAICTMLETSKNYLDCKKTTAINQRFMIIVNFKKYIAKCTYVSMLQQFQIIDVLDQFQPNLTPLTLDQIQKFFKYTQTKKIKGDLNLSNQLNKWVQINHLKKYKPKTQQMIDTRQLKNEQQESPTKKEQNNAQFNMSEFKAFENQLINIQDVYNKQYSNRIAKPVALERQIEKKKKKTTADETKKVINVIGRSGNKFIKKQVVYQDRSSAK